MSLINDALRRGNQKNTAAPVGGTPMQPVSPRKNFSIFGWFWLAIFLGIILVTGGWFFWKGFSAESEKNSLAPNHLTTISGLTPPAIVSNAPLVERKPAATLTAPNVVTETINPIAVAPTNLPITNAAPLLPVVTLKLQGIFYRGTKSVALINGKTLVVGDSILEARVLKIDPQDVTLERSGKTIVLTLPQ
ncbi:MAG: hypothetical protein ABJC04_05295 [Verrucomicrobiota bacterium]